MYTGNLKFQVELWNNVLDVDECFVGGSFKLQVKSKCQCITRASTNTTSTRHWVKLERMYTVKFQLEVELQELMYY